VSKLEKKIDPFYDLNQNDLDIDEYEFDDKRYDTLMENMIVQDEDESSAQLQRFRSRLNSGDDSLYDRNNSIVNPQQSRMNEDSKNNDVDLQQAT